MPGPFQMAAMARRNGESSWSTSSRRCRVSPNAGKSANGCRLGVRSASHARSTPCTRRAVLHARAQELVDVGAHLAFVGHCAGREPLYGRALQGVHALAQPLQSLQDAVHQPLYVAASPVDAESWESAHAKSSKDLAPVGVQSRVRDVEHCREQDGDLQRRVSKRET